MIEINEHDWSGPTVGDRECVKCGMRPQEWFGEPCGKVIRNVRILLNNNVKMSPGKAAAQAVHAALMAYGIEHGSVVVLQGSKVKIEAMDVQVHDAGLTEIKAGTLTAGASLEAVKGYDDGDDDDTK